MLKLDEKLTSLPFSKSSPEILKSIFGEKELSPRWIADLDFSLAEPLQKILIDRIKNSGFGYEYKDNSFLKAQEDWYQRRYEIDLKKHQRFFSPTIMTSLAIIIENFTDPEDGVIIQTPVYPEFKKVIGLQGREAVKNPLVLKQNGYEIDFDDLREKANEAKNKILLLCSPHNPVGRSWHFDELEKVVNICRENNLLLISDEIHRDIMLFKNRFISICSFSEHFQNFFMLASEAKTFNLCSICDSLIVTPNEKIGEKVKRTLNKYQLGRTNGLTRAVLQGIYEMDDAWTHALIEVVEKNVSIIRQELREAKSKIRLVSPEATYLVWLDFREIFADGELLFKKVINEAKIAVNFGRWFGREGDLFLRMNIGTTPEIVTDIIKKIINIVK